VFAIDQAYQRFNAKSRAPANLVTALVTAPEPVRSPPLRSSKIILAGSDSRGMPSLDPGLQKEKERV
jgi:hypothetical protein